jgi:outer membrane lipoprotein LolB
MRAAGRTAGALLLVLLAGCAQRQVRPADDALLAAQAVREAALAAQPQWRMSGRFAVSGEGEGGSGRLDWQQRADGYVIEISAPVTRRSLRLIVNGDGARLEGLEQGPLSGADPQRLLYEATGWTLPLQPLMAWARGARARGPAELEFGTDGLPLRLQQQGWQVEYRSWDTARSPALPLRVFANSGERRVRLVVDRWELSDG